MLLYKDIPLKRHMSSLRLRVLIRGFPSGHELLPFLWSGTYEKRLLWKTARTIQARGAS